MGSKLSGRDQGLPLETAAVWVSMYYGGITVGRFITGFVTLKINNLILIRAGQVTAIAGAVLLLLPLHPNLSLIGLIVIGLGLAPIFPCMLHETPARFGRAIVQNHGVSNGCCLYRHNDTAPLFGLVAAQISIGLFPVVILLFALIMMLSSEKVNRILYKAGRARFDSNRALLLSAGIHREFSFTVVLFYGQDDDRI